MNKKVLSLVLSSTMVFASVATAFAATGDVYNVGGDLFATGNQMNLSTNLQKQVNVQQGSYHYEYDGQKYTMKDAQDAFVTAGGDMDQFGTEIAKKDPVGEVTEDLAISGLKVVTTTKIVVTLNKAVDSVVPTNFEIQGVAINEATLSKDKSQVTLVVESVAPKASYTLTASGLTIDGVAQENLEKAFVVPSVEELYSPALTYVDADGVLKADGADQTLVTFALNDAEGNLVAGAQDVEVAFAATFGTFGEKRVSVQDGIATVLLTSEFLTAKRTSELTATVVNAKDQSLIGLVAAKSIVMDPNPSTGGEESVGASMTDAEANQADRIIVYFNKSVTPEMYMKADGIDPALAEVTVHTNATNSTEGRNCAVAGLLPVQGNPQALQVMLNVEASAANALEDNSDVWVKFIDKTGNVSVDKNLTFKNTDGRTPSMLGVTPSELNKLVVNFSEAMEKKSAIEESNWQIDGISLGDTNKWGDATIEVGSYIPAIKNGGVDQRSIVTITLGENEFFKAGKHSIQAAKVGDWAALTDKNNYMNTQTLDFTIPEDNGIPEASVIVQSPEQYLVTFNKSVTANNFAANLSMEKYDVATSAWVVETSSAGITKVDDEYLDLVVTPLGDNKNFLVETDYDWTNVYNTKDTKRNYYSDSHRLVINADAVINMGNGKGNLKQELSLNGAMLTPDTLSPEILDIVEHNTRVGAYVATMSEPVKLDERANAEGSTDSQNQGFTGTTGKWSNIPVPQAIFYSLDSKTQIEGIVDGAFNDKHEKQLVVTPTGGAILAAGNWRLAVMSISDDVGNTAATATRDFVIKGETPEEGVFDIEFAFADEDCDAYVERVDSSVEDTDNDYVFIKFTKPVAKTGDFKNALKTSNYTLDAYPLPNGTQIFAGINGQHMDSAVTIKLPEGTLFDKNEPHNINISKFIESTTGDVLGNKGGEKTLKYNVTEDDSLAIAQCQFADVVKHSFDGTITAGAVQVTLPGIDTLQATYGAIDSVVWGDSTIVDGAQISSLGAITHSTADDKDDTVVIEATLTKGDNKVVIPFKVVIPETKSPTITNIESTTSDAITVEFSEKVDADSVENLAAWVLTGTGVIDSVTLADDGRTVTITLSTPLADTDTLDTKDTILDLKGNKATEEQKTAGIAGDVITWS